MDAKQDAKRCGEEGYQELDKALCSCYSGKIKRVEIIRIMACCLLFTVLSP